MGHIARSRIRSLLYVAVLDVFSRRWNRIYDCGLGPRGVGLIEIPGTRYLVDTKVELRG
jgi:hypothetical protein